MPASAPTVVAAQRSPLSDRVRTDQEPVASSSTTPVYVYEYVTLCCGDARDILPALINDGQRWDACITDPVWPAAPTTIPGHHEADALLTAIASMLVGAAARLVVQVGSRTDPRWLRDTVDCTWPYICCQHLEYAMPSYRGRQLLNDIAYVFGTWPAVRDVPSAVAPGRLTCTHPIDVRWHPAPRAYDHVVGLVKWWAGSGPIIDPFAGSGTTLLAAKTLGVRCVGIEREPAYCDGIIRRLAQ